MEFKKPNAVSGIVGRTKAWLDSAIHDASMEGDTWHQGYLHAMRTAKDYIELLQYQQKEMDLETCKCPVCGSSKAYYVVVRAKGPETELRQGKFIWCADCAKVHWLNDEPTDWVKGYGPLTKMSDEEMAGAEAERIAQDQDRAREEHAREFAHEGGNE